MTNGLNSNTNNKVLQIISSEHNFDFHRRAERAWRTRTMCPGQPRASAFCRGNDFSLEDSEVGERKDRDYAYHADENNGQAFDLMDTS
jgi:hypothetical protein